jgi:hypothetical protein
MTDTYEKVKEGVKKVAGKVEDSAEKVVDPDTYTGSDDEKERTENEKGGKEPMNPEDIAEHEPTAVKRDKNRGSSGEPV